MTGKKYDSVEQALVEELGAELLGTYEPLGEFLVQDGDGYNELVDQSVSWLKSKSLIPRGAKLTNTDLTVAVSMALGVIIRVYSKKGWTEYTFILQPDGGLTKKHYHFVKVSVLILPKNESSMTSGMDGDPTPLEERGPGYNPDKRGGPPGPLDEDKRY